MYTPFRFVTHFLICHSFLDSLLISIIKINTLIHTGSLLPIFKTLLRLYTS